MSDWWEIMASLRWPVEGLSLGSELVGSVTSKMSLDGFDYASVICHRGDRMVCNAEKEFL